MTSSLERRQESASGGALGEVKAGGGMALSGIEKLFKILDPVEMVPFFIMEVLRDRIL